MKKCFIGGPIRHIFLLFQNMPASCQRSLSLSFFLDSFAIGYLTVNVVVVFTGCVLAAISENYLTSVLCTKEVRMANDISKPVIPLVLPETCPKDNPTEKMVSSAYKVSLYISSSILLLMR